MATETEKEKVFYTSDVAKLFGKKTVWVYYAERAGHFKRADGSLIVPRRTIPPHTTSGYREYTSADVKEMLDAVWRRGNITKEVYLTGLTKLAEMESGLFEPEDETEDEPEEQEVS